MSAPEILFNEDKHEYTVNGVVYPSVTQILDVLNKPGLPWWGQTTGVKGVQHLRSLGVELPWDDAEGITKLLTEHKLTVNHVRDGAGTRGSSLHTALERWMANGSPPNAADFPVEDRGYVQGLARALLVLQPEVIATEVMVASVKHGFAGRYDLRAKIDGEVALLDLKTSKRVYPDQHFPQLEGYEGASVECGEDPSDVRLVLRLGADGSFEVARSYATYEDFLAIKRAFDALRRMKAARPRKQRQAAA